MLIIPAEKRSKKNGKIEFLRFYFSIAVLLFHAYKYFFTDFSDDTIHLALVPHGAMGVDFFFMVSGWLMAKSAFSKANSADEAVRNADLGVDTRQFIWNKICGILPFHIVAFVLTIGAYAWQMQLNLGEVLLYSLESIPSFFLLQMSGISAAAPNHIEWYLSVMFLIMLLLYPILRKRYSLFVNVIAPIVGIFVLGWMCKSFDRVTGVLVWDGVCYRSMLRGLADISLGAFAFDMSRRLEAKPLSTGVRVFLTLVELACMVGITVFLLRTYPCSDEIYCVLAVFAVVVLAFSNQTYGEFLFQNRVCFFLGKLSLPIYLSQLACIYVLQRVQQEAIWTPGVTSAVAAGATVVLALGVLGLGTLLSKAMFKKKA